MAWRPTEYLIEGELDNTVRGKVTGWMKFQGLSKKVTFNLTGEFHRDIRGTVIKIKGLGLEKDIHEARRHMKRFSLRQNGSVGDITAGRPPADYSKYPYVEWYSDDNGRVVIELDDTDIEVIGTPIPILESDPIDRKTQDENMRNFLNGLMGDTKEQ